MTDKKTEALKLALEGLDKATKYGFGEFEEEKSAISSAVQLKKAEQPAQQEPVDILKQALEIIAVGDSADPQQDACDSLIEAGFWASGSKPAQQQEPVAWLSTDCIGERYLCFTKPQDNDPVQPLYTSPPASKPLTNLSVLKLAYNHHWLTSLTLRDAYFYGFRDAEAAHGITGEQK